MFFLNLEKAKSIMAINVIITMSVTDSESTFNGEIVADMPRMNITLKRLEPTTFPSASPLSPLPVATIEVTSSGSDVPMAMIVSPIKFWESPKDSAITTALSTTRFPP